MKKFVLFLFTFLTECFISYAQPTDGEVQADSTDSSSSFVFIIILLFFGAKFIIKFLKRLYDGRCSKCKKLRAMKVVDEDYLGPSRKKWQKDSNGKSYQVYYNNIKVTRQCKYCGHREWYKEEQKG